MRPRSVTAWLACLLIAAVAMVGAACADGSTVTTTSDPLGNGPTATSTPATAPTTTTPSLTLSPLDKELAKTAKTQNEFIGHLARENATDDDPRVGLLFGLRARTQALSCLKALSAGDMEVAGLAMMDVYHTLNRGRNVAEGEVAQILAEAHAAIETVGDPTRAPETAAERLDDFVSVLAPLLDQANAITATTGSS